MAKSVRGCDTQTIFPLVTAMTPKLRFLKQMTKRIRYPACLMQEMDWLETPTDIHHIEGKKCESEPVLSGFLHGDTLEGFSDFRKIVAVVSQTGHRLLSLCGEFSTTPTLMIIKLLCRPLDKHWRPVKLEDLMIIPGDTPSDRISIFWEHRHVIRFYNSGHGLCMGLMGRTNGFEGWLSPSAWETQYVFLVFQCLKSILSSKYRNNWETLDTYVQFPFFCHC